MFFTAPRVIPEPPVDGFPSANPRQAGYNEDIKQRLAGKDEEGKERLLDALRFAFWMSPNLPGVELLVSSAPVITLHDLEGEFYITINHGNAAFSVDESPYGDSTREDQRVALGRRLLKNWNTLIAHLPEGFIIYGPDVDLNHPSFPFRESVLQGLGFAPVEANGDRMAIVRGGQLSPLTAFQHHELTGEDGPAHLYNQRLCVEEIVWGSKEAE